MNPDENILRLANINQASGRPRQVTLAQQKEWLPRACQNLNKILQATDAKIVISSTWRLSYSIHELDQILTNNGILAKVHGVTPSFNSDSLIVPGTRRGVEIAAYLKAHPEITNYVILDDDSDMLIEQKPYFILVSTGVGLTDRQAQHAIQKLNDEHNERKQI